VDFTPNRPRRVPASVVCNYSYAFIDDDERIVKMNGLFPDLEMPPRARNAPPKVSEDSRPYRPSNGTEGDMFMSQFCYSCVKYTLNKNTGDYDCKHDIIQKTQVYEVDSKHYPKWWVEDLDGKNARCLLYKAK